MWFFIPYILLMIPLTTLSQPPDTLWTRTYSASPLYDCADMVRQTADGGYILSGRSHQLPSMFDSRIYIIKTDFYGDTLWTRNYWRGLNDDADCIVQTADEGYITAGHSTIQSVGYDIYWLELDIHGYRIDYTLYGAFGPDEGHCIQATLDGNYAICGYDRMQSYPNNDICFIKIDPTGNIIWVKNYRGPNHESATWFVPTDDGYILVGATESYGAGASDAYIIKTNLNGDSLWCRTFGRENNEALFCVQQTFDDGFIMCGYTASTSNGNQDILVIKTDSSGHTDWIKTYGGEGNDAAYGILQSMEGEYLVVGFTESWGAGDSDAYFLKLDSQGNRIWHKTLGGVGADRAYKALQIKSGDFIICGTTCLGSGGGNDAWLICLESDLCLECAKSTHSIWDDNPADMGNCPAKIYNLTPNPFNNTTEIAFEIKSASTVKIVVYDILGHKIMTLTQMNYPPGRYSIPFNGRDLVSGIYLLQLETGSSSQTKKCILLK